MSRDRIDGSPRPAPTPLRPEGAPAEGAPKRRRPATGVEAVQASEGRLFTAQSGARARHVNQAAAGRPAQLQVHRAPLGVPATPVQDVATGQARPVTPLRRAFDSLAPRAVTADIRLLEGNNESWLSIWSALGRSQGDLDLSYFIFQRDIFGMATLGQLYLAAQEGRQVRMMLDAAGDAFGKKGFTLSLRGQDYLQELVNTGHANVKVYHPLHKKLLTNLKSDVRPFAGVANNHDKLLRTHDTVVTGGRNISKDYFTDPADRDDVYRDTDMMIRGRAAAQAFRGAFDKEWNRDDIQFKVVRDAAGNLLRRDIEIVGAKVMMDLWLDGAALGPADKDRLRADQTLRTKMAEDLVRAVQVQLPAHGIARAANAWDRANLLEMAKELVSYAELRGAAKTYDPDKEVHARQEIKVIDRTSAAVTSEDDLTAALAALASGARHRILIQNPYVVLTKNAVAALEAAGERGVQIDLLTNSPDSTDSLLTQAFFLEDWPRVLARVPNMRIFVLTGAQKLHAKVATADDQISVVGSYNLDLLSEQVNGEIAATSWSAGLARDIRASFDADRKNPANKVVEYTIQRDAEGRPVLKDGNPVITFGPDDHISGWNKVKYAVMCWMVRQARKLPSLSDISGIELPKA